MKKEKQFELLLNLPAIIRQNNAPEPEDFDDARFFVKQGNILWIYHDEDAPEENTVCCYELYVESFVSMLKNVLEENDDTGSLFDIMEEQCSSHVAATAENPLHEKLENIYSSNDGFVGSGRNKNTLHELINAVYCGLQYSDISEAPYDDVFFVDNDAKYVTWMYFNPDSSAGGQFVNNGVSFAQILEAAKRNTAEDFFSYLGSVAYQTLEDIGTVEFEAEKHAFLQKPDFENLTEKTMRSLIAAAKGGEKHE